jgi:SMODS and SLOG-associating 2TM effector domain
MRGSKEPQLSITRAKDLEQFERECEAFIMDHGHVTSGSEDAKINDLRRRFEELLGNASG